MHGLVLQQSKAWTAAQSQHALEEALLLLFVVLLGEALKQLS